MSGDQVSDGNGNSRFSCSFVESFSHLLHSRPRPRARELVNSFEKTLLGRLDGLKPKNLDFLNLAWIRQAMEVLSKTYEDLKILIGDLEIRGGGEVRGQWITDCLNDSIKLLNVCNGLSADISVLDHNQLILIRSVCSLLELSSSIPQQDNLCKARTSLQEWIENPGCKKNRIEEHLGILQGLSADLELQMGWRSWGTSSRLGMGKGKGKGKGKSIFLRAMSGVKAMIILICSVISCALSRFSVDQQGPQGKPLVEVQVPSQLLWSASFMSLQKAINEEMIRTRNKFLLNEWKSLDNASRQLYGILDKIPVDHKPPFPGETELSCPEWEAGEKEEQQCKKHMVRQGVEELRQSSEWEAGEKEEQQSKKHMVRQGVEELRQSSEAVTEGVRLLTFELNDLFRVVLNVNTALLDNVKLSPQPHSKMFHNYISHLKMKIRIRKPKRKLRAVILRINKKWRLCGPIRAASCLRIPKTL